VFIEHYGIYKYELHVHHISVFLHVYRLIVNIQTIERDFNLTKDIHFFMKEDLVKTQDHQQGRKITFNYLQLTMVLDLVSFT
jgi:hypothetical protein